MSRTWSSKKEASAWVTLTTNDSYALGALVLAASLKRVGTKHELAILVTPGVSQAMKAQLRAAFNHVEEVDVLDSKDVANLKLLTRPELGITFTKLHCWRLVQYEKCVFLDADTLVLQNCDELFEKEEFSAAPDAGWPDCFNSGVFVYKPSADTFSALIDFALIHGSFDGGDQGLLNLYFKDWATKDISKHLSFVYNMCSTATYSYLPALKQYGQNIKIIHFIGTSKPWLHQFNAETQLVSISETTTHLAPFLQTWWDLFCTHVHPVLSSEMSGIAGALSKIKLGSAASAGNAVIEDHLRRQSWEQGVIDYMGRDAFTNIWDKICQTVGGPSQPEIPEETVESTSEAPADINLVATSASTEQVSVTAVQTSIVGSTKTEVSQPQPVKQAQSADGKKTVPPISTSEQAPSTAQPATPTVIAPTPPLSPVAAAAEAVEALTVSEAQPPVPPKRHQKKTEEAASSAEKEDSQQKQKGKGKGKK
ncbi:glycogenin-1 isoform X6 [Bemisia tabaci]|uniref:glycogenin-1 isoform X6 n=1 Tax=Bemisia tabaci TaxID=7038 RepID=UPI0008F98ABE|nr:PREDICTED: glycogenin-1 isoform X5 [Bemisia tabaci]